MCYCMCCVYVFICCWDFGLWRLTVKELVLKALGIFSSQGLCVELFSIYYWQVSGWAEVSTGNQTGEGSDSLCVDPFPLLLSVSHFTLLPPVSLSSHCFLHFILVAVYL